MSSDLHLFTELQSFLNAGASTLNEIPENERLGYDPQSVAIAQGVFDPSPVVNNSPTISTATVEENNDKPTVQPTRNNEISIGSKLVAPDVEHRLDFEHGLDEAIQGVEDIIGDSEQNDSSSEFDYLFDDTPPTEVESSQENKEPKSTEVEREVNSNHPQLQAPLQEGVINEQDLSKQGGQHKSDDVASNLEQDEEDSTEFDADLNAAFDAELELPVESDVVPSLDTDLDAEMAAEMEAEMDADLDAEMAAEMEAEMDADLDAAMEAEIQAEMEADFEASFQEEMEHQTQENGDISEGSSNSSDRANHGQSLSGQTSSQQQKHSSVSSKLAADLNNPQNLEHHKVQAAARRVRPSNGTISGNSILPKIRNEKPSGPGPVSKFKKSSKRGRRVSNFPWIYNKHIDFTKDVKPLGASADADQGTGFDEDEDEDDDESLGSVDEEPDTQSEDAGTKLVIDLTNDDDVVVEDDEGVQDGSLALNSLQNIYEQRKIMAMKPFQLGNHPVVKYPTFPAPHIEAPLPSIPTGTEIPESQQPFPQNPSVQNSTLPNPQTQSLNSANEGLSSDSDMPGPGSNTQNNAKKRKAHQLEPSPSEGPVMEQQAKRPRNSPSTNENSAPMYVNFQVQMANQNMNPNLHMQMGQQNVNQHPQMHMGQQNVNQHPQMHMGQQNVNQHPQIQMAQQNANPNMQNPMGEQNINTNLHVRVSEQQIQASGYMNYRLPQLKKLLKDRRIRRTGNKPDFVRRLMESDIRRDNRIQRQLLLENRIKQSQNFGDADVESLPEAHSAEMMGGSKNFQQSHGQPQYQPSNSRGVANGGSFPVFHPAQGMGAVSANIHHPKPRRMIPGDFHGTKIYTHMSLNSSAQSFMNGGLVGATNNLHSNPNNGGFPDIHDQPYQPWMVDSFNGSANTLSYQTFNSSGMEYDNGGYQQPMNNGPIGNTNGFLPYQSQPAPRGTSSGFGQKQPNGNCGGNFGGADMNRTMADLMGWMDKVSPEGEWSGMN